MAVVRRIRHPILRPGNCLISQQPTVGKFSTPEIDDSISIGAVFLALKMYL